MASLWGSRKRTKREMRIEPFDPSHLVGAVAHPNQGHYQKVFESDWHAQRLATAGPAWSAFSEDGLVAVGGLVSFEGTTSSWLIFTTRITPDRFVAIYRELVRRLDALRAEGEAVMAHLDPGYPEAARLAASLGFLGTGTDFFDDGTGMTRMIANA